MANLINQFPTADKPNDAETHLAQDSSLRLAKYFARKRTAPVKLHVEKVTGETDADDAITIPVSAFRLLSDILAQMAQGNGVTLIPIHEELTTQQAAELLGVSRPFLIELLDQGSIPHRKVGTHRRILLKDLTAYQQWMNARRLQSLEQLSKLDQELGLGY